MSATQEVIEQTEQKTINYKVSKCEDILSLIFEPQLMKTFTVSNFESLGDLNVNYNLKYVFIIHVITLIHEHII